MKQKEPWEMTRAEFESTGVEEMVAEIMARWDALSEAQKRQAWGGPSASHIRATRQNDNLQYHSAQVRKALSEGKPVPAEVLKDYPKLASTRP